jgi:hypothetical protein
MVFAGLKPDAPAPVAARKSRIESLMESAEDLASRGMESTGKPLPGPMTWRQKAGIVFALLATGVFIYFLVSTLQRPAERAESKAAPPAPLQIIAPGVQIEKNKDLEVVQMEFHKNSDPKSITGTLRNRTGKTFARCEVSFDVSNKEGAQLGGASTRISNLGPHAEVRFRIEVPQKDAGFVLVRELRTE